MTNKEKFIEVFGDNPKRHYITKPWEDEEYLPPTIIEADKVARKKMISVEKMEEITEILVNGIFRDDEIMYCEMPLVEYNGKRYDLRDIVATLHNYLYEAVEGKRYDYMFHWANKVLADCDDDVFEEKN